MFKLLLLNIKLNVILLSAIYNAKIPMAAQMVEVDCYNPMYIKVVLVRYFI